METEINTSMYNQLIFEKDAKMAQGEDSPSINGAEETGFPM
jgi:hypothetical protein